VSGKFKPFPDICPRDVAFIDDMIAQKYIPYQNIPESLGKTVEEIRRLGKRHFPFSPYSFQLAMCVYDWTTASFTRMIFLKIFEYTGIGQPPFPIDQHSIARAIWTSNWGKYTPQNRDFMNSFMMKPAWSLLDVELQLTGVASKLQHFSDVQNRLLSAAMQSLPRTSTVSHRKLFSGQIDIRQLGLDVFGVEFLECPSNKGPVGKPLRDDFEKAISTYISKGKIITTKMVWSFTDRIRDAVDYSNGILLVVEAPADSWVWERVVYITPLSHSPDKNEYIFMRGTEFEVQSVNKTTLEQKPMVVITLQPKNSKYIVTEFEMPKKERETRLRSLRGKLRAWLERVFPIWTWLMKMKRKNDDVPAWVRL
jgi:hypothetical protein